MSLVQNYPLTIRTLAFLALITIFVLMTGDLITNYFELIYYVPGLFFSILYCVTSLANQKSVLNIMVFIFASTTLYALTYVGSWLFVFFGICIIPSIGAMLFLKLSSLLLNEKFSNRIVQWSLLAGPISGGFTTLILLADKDLFGLIFFLPIPIWWIFMSLLIDVATQNKENV